jgi:hypothetical protein
MRSDENGVKTAVEGYEHAMKEVIQYRGSAGQTEIGGLPAADWHRHIGQRLGKIRKTCRSRAFLCRSLSLPTLEESNPALRGLREDKLKSIRSLAEFLDKECGRLLMVRRSFWYLSRRRDGRYTELELASCLQIS